MLTVLNNAINASTSVDTSRASNKHLSQHYSQPTSSSAFFPQIFPWDKARVIFEREGIIDATGKPTLKALQASVPFWDHRQLEVFLKELLSTYKVQDADVHIAGVLKYARTMGPQEVFDSFDRILCKGGYLHSVHKKCQASYYVRYAEGLCPGISLNVNIPQIFWGEPENAPDIDWTIEASYADSEKRYVLANKVIKYNAIAAKRMIPTEAELEEIKKESITNFCDINPFHSRSTGPFQTTKTNEFFVLTTGKVHDIVFQTKTIRPSLFESTAINITPLLDIISIYSFTWFFQSNECTIIQYLENTLSSFQFDLQNIQIQPFGLDGNVHAPLLARLTKCRKVDNPATCGRKGFARQIFDQSRGVSLIDRNDLQELFDVLIDECRNITNRNWSHNAQLEKLKKILVGTLEDTIKKHAINPRLMDYFIVSYLASSFLEKTNQLRDACWDLFLRKAACSDSLFPSLGHQAEFDLYLSIISKTGITDFYCYRDLVHLFAWSGLLLPNIDHEWHTLNAIITKMGNVPAVCILANANAQFLYLHIPFTELISLSKILSQYSLCHDKVTDSVFDFLIHQQLALQLYTGHKGIQLASYAESLAIDMVTISHELIEYIEQGSAVRSLYAYCIFMRLCGVTGHHEHLCVLALYLPLMLGQLCSIKDKQKLLTNFCTLLTAYNLPYAFSDNVLQKTQSDLTIEILGYWLRSQCQIGHYIRRVWKAASFPKEYLQNEHLSVSLLHELKKYPQFLYEIWYAGLLSSSQYNTNEVFRLVLEALLTLSNFQNIHLNKLQAIVSESYKISNFDKNIIHLLAKVYEHAGNSLEAYKLVMEYELDKKTIDYFAYKYFCSLQGVNVFWEKFKIYRKHNFELDARDIKLFQGDLQSYFALNELPYHETTFDALLKNTYADLLTPQLKIQAVIIEIEQCIYQVDLDVAYKSLKQNYRHFDTAKTNELFVELLKKAIGIQSPLVYAIGVDVLKPNHVLSIRWKALHDYLNTVKRIHRPLVWESLALFLSILLTEAVSKKREVIPKKIMISTISLLLQSCCGIGKTQSISFKHLFVSLRYLLDHMSNDNVDWQAWKQYFYFLKDIEKRTFPGDQINLMEETVKNYFIKAIKAIQSTDELDGKWMGLKVLLSWVREKDKRAFFIQVFENMLDHPDLGMDHLVFIEECIVSWNSQYEMEEHLLALIKKIFLKYVSIDTKFHTDVDNINFNKLHYEIIKPNLYLINSNIRKWFRYLMNRIDELNENRVLNLGLFLLGIRYLHNDKSLPIEHICKLNTISLQYFEEELHFTLWHSIADLMRIYDYDSGYIKILFLELNNSLQFSPQLAERILHSTAIRIESYILNYSHNKMEDNILEVCAIVSQVHLSNLKAFRILFRYLSTDEAQNYLWCFFLYINRKLVSKFKENSKNEIVMYDIWKLTFRNIKSSNRIIKILKPESPFHDYLMHLTENPTGNIKAAKLIYYLIKVSTRKNFLSAVEKQIIIFPLYSMALNIQILCKSELDETKVLGNRVYYTWMRFINFISANKFNEFQQGWRMAIAMFPEPLTNRRLISLFYYYEKALNKLSTSIHINIMPEIFYVKSELILEYIKVCIEAYHDQEMTNNLYHVPPSSKLIDKAYSKMVMLLEESLLLRTRYANSTIMVDDNEESVCSMKEFYQNFILDLLILFNQFKKNRVPFTSEQFINLIQHCLNHELYSTELTTYGINMIYDLICNKENTFNSENADSWGALIKRTVRIGRNNPAYLHSTELGRILSKISLSSKLFGIRGEEAKKWFYEIGNIGLNQGIHFNLTQFIFDRIC